MGTYGGAGLQRAHKVCLPSAARRSGWAWPPEAGRRARARHEHRHGPPRADAEHMIGATAVMGICHSGRACAGVRRRKGARRGGRVERPRLEHLRRVAAVVSRRLAYKLHPRAGRRVGRAPVAAVARGPLSGWISPSARRAATPAARWISSQAPTQWRRGSGYKTARVAHGHRVGRAGALGIIAALLPAARPAVVQPPRHQAVRGRCHPGRLHHCGRPPEQRHFATHRAINGPSSSAFWFRCGASPVRRRTQGGVSTVSPSLARAGSGEGCCGAEQQVRRARCAVWPPALRRRAVPPSVANIYLGLTDVVGAVGSHAMRCGRRARARQCVTRPQPRDAQSRTASSGARVYAVATRDQSAQQAQQRARAVRAPRLPEPGGRSPVEGACAERRA